MKKLLLFCVLLVTAWSCSVDGDEKRVNFHLDFMSVQSVDLPEYFERGHEYEITVHYIKPTDCHYFQGFYYEPDGYIHTIAPQAMVLEDAGCRPFENLTVEEATFTFPCPDTYSYGQYVFRFYQGEDNLTNQLFYEVTVPIAN